MNKFKKALVGIAVGAVAAAGVAGLAACGSSITGTYEGEYHYTSGTTEYGVKVSVEVEKNVIQSVTILESDYTEATEMVLENYWDGGESYYAGRADLLKAYEGMTVKEVLSLEVAVNAETGAPLAANAEGFNNFGDDLIITGATQSSGRLLLAVQNALEKA